MFENFKNCVFDRLNWTISRAENKCIIRQIIVVKVV